MIEFSIPSSAIHESILKSVDGEMVTNVSSTTSDQATFVLVQHWWSKQRFGINVHSIFKPRCYTVDAKRLKV